MVPEAVKGTLYLVVQPGTPGSAEDRLAFGSLQELLDLLASHQGSAAFTRVEVVGKSGGTAKRLVLDFGHFSDGQL
jgi:hypothetical protein